jgi:hypothetical protein
METLQMMELLLARMNSSIKEHMQEMTARMKPTKAHAKHAGQNGHQPRKADAIHKEMMAKIDN